MGSGAFASGAMGSPSVGETGSTGRFLQGVFILGPGTSILNSGWGIDATLDAVAKTPTGAFTYGLVGTKGFFLNGIEDVSVLALFFS